MSLDIKIIETDKSKPEYQYAKKLEGIFKEAEPSINGEVIIRSNPILYGQGNREELDIVVICKLKNYLPGKIKFFKSDNKDKNKLIQLIEGDVIFTNLCFVIECKSHNTNGIQYKSETLMVKYKEGWDDVTSQSREQEFTLRGYFMDKVKYSPIIANFIWLTNINSQDIKQLTGDHKKHNLLPRDFNLLWLLTLLAVQKKPFELGLKEIKSNNNNEENKEEGNRKNKRYMCTMAYQKDIDNFNECFKSFDEIKKIESVMTRDKIERITTRLLKDQQYGKSINEKLIQIQGKPGTGKTVKLLRLCYDIAMRNNNRCLILTYNKALVSDISRTLVHMKIPRKLQEEGIYIRTLHSYFFRLMRGFEIFDKNKKSVDIKFLENYDDYLNEFYEYIENEIITKEDIYKNIKSNHHELNWDYLFIDEGQDWNVKERDILYKLYGHSKILVTVGEEQKIRAPLLCDWTYQLTHDKDYVNTYSRKSLRQRSNLVNFTNGYAKHVGLNDWDVEPSDNLLGGKIIISKVSNNFDLFNKHIEECKKVGNSEYDFMFLSPPNLINKKQIQHKSGRTYQDSYFSDTEVYQKHGVHIWDGTKSDIRTTYPTNPNEHRLYQYDSCRGLESWTTVCLNFDEFIKYKHETYKDPESESLILALETMESKIHAWAYHWALIPLTRAIDTLIITLKDPESIYSKQILEISSRYSDFVEVIN